MICNGVKDCWEMKFHGFRTELDPLNPSPDMFLGTKKSLFLTYGHIGWAPLCSLSKQFLSAYYVLGVGHVIISNEDVAPSHGTYSLAYALPPCLP